jgi:hypothetical protein
VTAPHVTDRGETTKASDRCARRGASLLDFATLAATSARARQLIRDRKLVVPDVALADLVTLAAQLRCRGGLCGAPP